MGGGNNVSFQKKYVFPFFSLTVKHHVFFVNNQLLKKSGSLERLFPNY